MNAAIYARVSTQGKGQSPEMQLRELREFCARRGWTVAGEYVDVASGAKEHRPELDRLLADCRRRGTRQGSQQGFGKKPQPNGALVAIDAVIVYRYDRFARSLRQLVNALEEFRALGVEFVSLHEGVDTSTPNGRLVFGIFASIAEFERELIRERVRSGLAAARARGTRLGRPGVEVDAEEVARLRAAGVSWRTIAGRLGIGVGTAFRAYQERSQNLSSEDRATG
ncbi:MAG: recombinase family protein [Burkholderiales bacterium]